MLKHIEFVSVTLAVLLGSALTANVTECYTCQSPRNAGCDDPFNAADAKTLQCWEPSGTNMLATVASEERTANATMTGVCVKLDITYPNSTVGVVRGCFTSADNVDTCNFLKQETKDATVNACNVCTETGCNSGTFLQVSAILLGVAMFLGSKV